MMRRKLKLYGPRPEDVTLSDGTVLKDFPVLVAESPDDQPENKAQPTYDHCCLVDKSGQIPRRRTNYT